MSFNKDKASSIVLRSMFKLLRYILLIVVSLGSSIVVAQENDLQREQLMLSFKRQVVEGQINTIVKYKNMWVFGGGFKSTVNRSLDYIAGWDGSYLKPLMSGLTDSVHVLKVNGVDLFVGGSFRSEGSQVFNGIVKWDGSKWIPQGKGVNGTVYAIAISGNYIYIGGNFSQSGSNKVSNIARRSLDKIGSDDEWQALDNGVNGPVYALSTINSRLIVGGGFSRAGSLSVQNIVEWDGTTWKALGNGIPQTVFAVEWHKEALYASGSASNSGLDAGKAHLYRYNENWVIVGNQAVIGKIKALKSYENDLYLAGDFVSPHLNITKWDGLTYSDVGGADREVNALELSSDMLMIGGRFTTSLKKRNALFETLYLKKPATPILIQPTANQTSVTTTPAPVEWSGSENSQSYLIQYWLKNKIDNKDSLLTTITADQTQKFLNLNLRGSTAYQLRIKAINELDSSAWSPTITFTTRIGSPKPLYPLNSTKGLGNTITFRWESIPNATRYILNVVDQQTQGRLTNLTEIISDSTNVTLSNVFQSNTRYEWRVKAENNSEFSDFSVPVSFLVRLAPEAPLITQPLDNSKDLPRSLVQLKWAPVISADYYMVEYFTDSTDLKQFKVALSTSFIIENLKENTVYNWRIRSVNESGEGITSWRRFSTGVSTLAEVIMISPATNKTNETRTPVLVWRSVKFATKYRVQMARSLSDLVSNNPERLTVNQVVNDTTYQVRDLAKATNYIWHVKAINDAGVEGSYQPVKYSFTTINMDLLDRVSLISPVNNQSNTQPNIRFEWATVSGATSYRLQISNRADFATTILDDKNIATTQKDIVNLRSSSTFYWRVAAINVAGESNWSTVRSFETAIEIPEAPTIIQPINASLEVPLLTTISWNAVIGAERYILFRDINPFFSSSSRDSIATSQASFTFSNSIPQTNYYVKVKSINSKGQSEWSPILNYTTTIQKPESVSLLEPTHLKRLTSDPITLKWTSSSEADYYWLQISTDPQFLVVDKTYEKVTTNQYYINKTDVFTPFYWRVKAVNRAGESAWSSIFSFTNYPKQPAKPLNLKPVSNLDYSGNQINLSWDSESFVDDSQLQVAKSPLFDSSNLIIDTSLTTNKFTVDSTVVQKDTRYHWRVRTRYKTAESDWSVWSDTLNFRTLPPNPPTPRIIKPQSREENVVLPVQLEWTQVENADEYYLFVYKESEPDNKVIELTKSNIYGIKTILDFDTKYCVEVRAVNSKVGISSFNSPTICFRTIEAPPSKPKLLSPADSTLKLTRAQQFKWFKTAGAREYLFELAKNRSFSEMIYSKSIKNPADTTLNYTLEYNTLYYWRVKAINNGGSSVSTTSAINTHSYNRDMAVSINLVFSGTKQEDYKLVGISGNYDVQYDVYNIFGSIGKPNFDWVVYEEKGTQLLTQSTISKCDNEENRCRFRPGKGFWLLSNSTWKYENTFPTRSLDITEMDSIPLNQGWNIISNPLDKTISWLEVIKANNLKSPGSGLHAFDKNYFPVDNFGVNQGYYFYNASGLSYLKLPYFVISGATSTVSALVADHHEEIIKEDQESLRLILENQEEQHLGEVEVLMNTSASLGLDSYDIPTPPLSFTRSYIAFENDSLLNGSRLFYSLGIPPEVDDFSHSIKLKVDKTGSYRIKLETETLEPSFMVTLLNQQTGKSIELETHAHTRLNLLKGENSFTIILSKISENGSNRSLFIPSKFELFKPYPNPFNPTTTITVAVPKDGRMTLRIYDITGRLVSELANRPISAGLHAFTWNASNYASGMYLVEAVSENQRLIKKITLIK